MYSLTPLITRKALKISSGSTFLEISAKALGTIEIPVPPTLEEQQAIGAIFTNLDAAINQHTLKHKALQQAKTARQCRSCGWRASAVSGAVHPFSNWRHYSLTEIGSNRRTKAPKVSDSCKPAMSVSALLSRNLRPKNGSPKKPSNACGARKYYPEIF